jgi:glycolate oxidase
MDMLTEAVKKELFSIVGPGSASASREDCICYSFDATNISFMPDAVLFPETSREISEVMRLANKRGFPVVPRGAGTGFTGGSVPVEGGVVLSLERMKKVIEIDPLNLTATVEPGVNTWEFQQEVEAMGLFYPPDPTSLRFSTIGGNIAECAGGPRAVKYGVTRDYVLSLQVVLPTGEVIETGVKTAKGVVGYDLTRLIVGSEGTLGIVTKATLRLLPLPEAAKTIVAIFGDIKDAAEAVSAIIRARIIPSTLEIMDKASIRCVEEFAPTGLSEAGALLLIEVQGMAEEVEREAREVSSLCLGSRATRVREASDKGEVKALWKARRAVSASLFRLRPAKINEDVVVPRSKVQALTSGIEEIAEKRGLIIACFGHAGDGNVHVNIMYEPKDQREAREAEDAIRDVFTLALSLGGTMSGEHGVGITKAPYLQMELGKDAIDVMKRIKSAFDPKGILNPGKIFPNERNYIRAGRAVERA